jgi:hypothetical protein
MVVLGVHVRASRTDRESGLGHPDVDASLVVAVDERTGSASYASWDTGARRLR